MIKKWLIIMCLLFILVCPLVGCSVAPVTVQVPGPTVTATVTATPPVVTITSTPPAITVTNTITVTPPAVTITATPSPLVLTPSPAATSPVAVATATLSSKTQLENYLNSNFSTCQTSLGSTSFDFSVFENSTIIRPYDYQIWVEYDRTFFSDIKYSNKYTTAQANQACTELKNFQEKLARAVIAAMPTKKLNGCYYYSYYEYPTIHEGYHSYIYYSWDNYSPNSVLTAYEDAKITGFAWDPEYDDKLTR